MFPYFFPLIQAKQCFKIIFERGIAHEDIIATLNTLITHSPQIAKVSDFSLLKVQDFHKHLLLHVIFFQGIF
jgi:hypothetical protein